MYIKDYSCPTAKDLFLSIACDGRRGFKLVLSSLQHCVSAGFPALDDVCHLNVQLCALLVFPTPFGSAGASTKLEGVVQPDEFTARVDVHHTSVVH